MKCSEELVYIRVSRVVDGPQCICAWLYLYVPDSLFLTLGVRFQLSDTSREGRDSINTATKHVFTIRCMALPRLRLFSFRLYDAKLFIGPPINEIRVPYANGAEVSPWC